MKFKYIEVGQKFQSCSSGLDYIRLDYEVITCNQEVNACCLSPGKYAGQCMIFQPEEEVIPC